MLPRGTGLLTPPWRFLILPLLLLMTACGNDNPTKPEGPVASPDFLATVQGPLTYKGHSYYRLANSDWSSAAHAAKRQFGAQLVKIDDASENDAVQIFFAQAIGPAGRIWLGLSDAASEGNFTYMDGSTPTYTQWEPGEPNNKNDEDYVAMYANNGNWVDVKDLANPPGIGKIYGLVEVDHQPAYIIQGPVTNPVNGHVYYRLGRSDWTTAENFAVDVMQAHLVSIQDAAENQFVLENFANAAGSGRVWLGLTDAASEGTFVNVDGTPVDYTNWDAGEPNDAGGGEDYVVMYSGNGRWVDVIDDFNPPGIGDVYGVVEVVPSP